MTESRTIGPVRIRAQVKAGKETGKWFVDIPSTLTSNGKRRRKLLDSKRMALEVARELRKRLDPITGLLKVRDSAPGILLTEAIDRWSRDEWLRVETLKKRETTLVVELYRLRSVERYFSKELLTSITATKLTEYQAFRLKSGIKPVSINTEIAVLGLVFQWANAKGMVAKVPKPEQIPVRPANVVIPTPEEVVRIISALPQNLKPIVRFLAETGCRKGEAINLTWDCIDEIGGYAEIKARDGWTPKTQQSERRIPLNDALLELIRSLPKSGEYVFTGSTPDTPIGSFRKSWSTAVKKASIFRRGQQVHVPVKVLRKAHATWQAERGTSESVLQNLLGHARGSRVTKKFYVHATEDAKKRAVITLPFERVSIDKLP